MNVVLVTIFDKKENLLLEHYLWYKKLGVKYFYYVNENMDSESELILNFLKNYDEHFYYSTNYHSNKKNSYLATAQQLLPEILKDSDYIFNVDIDEFLSIKNNSTIYDLIHHFKMPDVLSCSVRSTYIDNNLSKQLNTSSENSNYPWKSIWKRKPEIKSFDSYRPNYNNEKLEDSEWIMPLDDDDFCVLSFEQKTLRSQLDINSFSVLELRKYNFKGLDDSVYSPGLILNDLVKETKCDLSLKLDKLHKLIKAYTESKHRKSINQQKIINKQNLNINVCFYGITRSLNFTYSSIINNILAPLSDFCRYSVFAHYYDIDHVTSIRSNEDREVDKNQFRLLNYERVLLETNTEPSKYCDFELIKKFGDAWDNNFSSLRNLTLQLNSIRSVTSSMNTYNDADVCIFLRPDLTYHSNFKDTLIEILISYIETKESNIYLPNWQHYHGLNDRFAVCTGKHAIETYGNRIEQALRYCASESKPLHSENLVKFCLREAGISPKFFDLKASRTRSNGHVVNENFMRKNEPN